jgi:hypothetical protein
MSLFGYIKDRIKERDTQVAIGATAYTAAVAVIPPQYKMILDMIAGMYAAYVASTKQPLPRTKANVEDGIVAPKI